MLFRGLKTSIEFPLFPSHESHKSTHERERVNNSAFLRVDFLIASARTIRMSADRIRKLADTIRMLTGGNGAQNERKRAEKVWIEEEKNRRAEVWNKQREEM